MLTSPESTQQDDSQRQLKDLQYIDQSLRTVATQLLNVSNPEESKATGNAIKNNAQKLPEKVDTPMKEMTVNIGFGRPVNSKFSFFETSHPGQAMAITEEELEKELSSTRLMTAYKNHPTTTGGISTWILLNPPSTTIKTVEVDKKLKQSSDSNAKVTAKPTTLMERIDTTERVMEKVTLPVSMVVTMEEPTTTTATTIKKTILLATKKTEKTNEPPQTTPKPPQTTMSNLENKESPASTTKKVQTVRTTPKPKTATSKITLLAKPSILKASRPNQQARPKPATRRTTMKPDILRNDTASSSKIEKVTFRPVQMITVSKSKPEITEKPMFVTKIKASVLMDTQKTTTSISVPSTSTQVPTTTAKTISSEPEEISTKLKPVGTKNNVLKVQLKKPADDTNIEIEPIEVNAPVLKIEKVEKTRKNSSEDDEEKDALNSSQIDLKFDFNPELTKINVDSETSTSSTTTATTSSTTKKPRHSSKRKKDKRRRRKPSTSTTTTIAPLASSSTEIELVTLDPTAENGIQESKIAPETKIPANVTKTKKKQVQKPISTQIYNFLSREVMPSFGMMSLVGLGLGLASYFLYPFGGTIARRNYEVEPKYKYNLDEYGGNYGQSEEEVLSKVLQGMTANEDNKYPGTKDYDNYYQYQHYDGNYETTKKNDQRYSPSPMYRPSEITASVLKYRNTDYRYPDSTSTPNYYERPKHAEYSAAQASSGLANRQFVVGNVPKEYPPYEEKIPLTTGKLTNYETTESSPIKFEQDLNQNFNFPNPVQSYGQVQTARPEEGYEEVEITPTAVAVEHGPRSLKTKRSVDGSRSRTKRDSVIQVIPSKRELEEEKEEDLSNEILNIIDSALPGEEDGKTRKTENEISEDLEAKKRRQEEKVKLAEASTESSVEASRLSTGFSTVKDTTEFSVSTSADDRSETNSTESSKTTEQSNVEWIDSTTKPPEEQDGFGLFSFVKKVAEIKLRLGLTLLKHASEGFARYLGHVQKRINGEE